MCLNPLTIKNKAYFRLGGMPYLQVPCGRCEECANIKSMDYETRALAIYNSLPANWSVFFVTLTFAPEYLPTCDVVDYIGSFESDLRSFGKVWQPLELDVPCFNHELIRRFLKSFRQYWRRSLTKSHKEYNFGTHRWRVVVDKKPTADELPKILITSEYGDKKHRPHYHGIFFIPAVMSFSAFQELLHKFWHYGFTKSIKVKKMDGQLSERKEINALKYVVKYACKYRSWLPYYLTDPSVSATRPRKDIEPRVFLTHHFGAELEKRLVRANYISNKVTFGVDGKYKDYILPTYYRRRYFVDTIVDERRVVTWLPPNTPWNSSPKYEKKVLLKTHSEYKNDYRNVRKDDIRISISNDYDKLNAKVLSDGSKALPPKDAYVSYCMRLLDVPLFLPQNLHSIDNCITFADENFFNCDYGRNLSDCLSTWYRCNNMRNSIRAFKTRQVFGRKKQEQNFYQYHGIEKS